jgi:hypothetical protein
MRLSKEERQRPFGRITECPGGDANALAGGHSHVHHEASGGRIGIEAKPGSLQSVGHLDQPWPKRMRGDSPDGSVIEVMLLLS